MHVGFLGAFKNSATVAELIYGPTFTAPAWFDLPTAAEECADYSWTPNGAQRQGKLGRHEGLRFASQLKGPG